MSPLRVRLMANRYRLTFPHATAILRELEPDLEAVEPEWLTVAQTLETAEPGGIRPPGFGWRIHATLRPDDGPLHEHLTTLRAFAARAPDWLLQIPLPGNPAGLGRHQFGLVPLATLQFLRLLPHLRSHNVPHIWARTWPELRGAAIDFDRLDPCCDGLTGYFIELFLGAGGLPPARTNHEHLDSNVDHADRKIV